MPDDLTAGLHRCGPSNVQHKESSLTSVTRVTPDTAKVLKGWTSAQVEERLRKAVMVRTRLTAAAMTPDGLLTVIDTELSSAAEPIGGIGCRTGASAGRDHIVRDAVEALSWLRWLDVDDAGIMLARLDGASWKAVCWHHGISRPTADRRWRYALALIAWRLNGNGASRRPPSLRTLLGMRSAA